MRCSLSPPSTAHLRLFCVLAVYALFATSSVNASNKYPPFKFDAYTVVVSPNNLMAEDDATALQNGNYVYEPRGRDFISKKRPEGPQLQTVATG